VLVARADIFPDALSGNHLAGDVQSPIVLVNSVGPIPPKTQEALATIDPDNIIILGGETAVSEQVANDLRTGDRNVSRVEGATRFETASAIAREVGSTANTAVVASGENFPDALVSGALSYAEGLPLLLTPTASLHAEVRSFLTDNPGITRVIIPGGFSAVSESVANEIRAMGREVEQLRGGSRVETAAMVAELAVAEYAWSRAHVNIARGDDFPDALTVGPHSGAEQSVLLLTTNPTMMDDGAGSNAGFMSPPPDPVTGLEECGTGDIHIAGGFAAVSNPVAQEIRDLLTANREDQPHCFFADLALDKVVDMDTVTYNDTVTYTLTVTNAGPVMATNVTVTDSLPAGFNFVPEGSSDSCELVDGEVVCTGGSLAYQGSTSFEVVAHVTSEPGTYDNDASVTASETDPNPEDNQASATVTVVPGVADLALEKEADTEPVTVGDTVTYDLAVTNLGPNWAQNVTVMDTLPAGFDYDSSEFADDDDDAEDRCIAEGDVTVENVVVTCWLGDMDYGDVLEFSIIATVTADAQPGPNDNDAVVFSDTPDPDETNNDATATVMVNPIMIP
jgi:uncharacterized repeat protein (TIGR01451 family)